MANWLRATLGRRFTPAVRELGLKAVGYVVQNQKCIWWLDRRQRGETSRPKERRDIIKHQISRSVVHMKSETKPSAGKRTWNSGSFLTPQRRAIVVWMSYGLFSSDVYEEGVSEAFLQHFWLITRWWLGFQCPAFLFMPNVSVWALGVHIFSATERRLMRHYVISTTATWHSRNVCWFIPACCSLQLCFPPFIVCFSPHLILHLTDVCLLFFLSSLSPPATASTRSWRASATSTSMTLCTGTSRWVII